MTLLSAVLLAALSAADAIATMLNTPSACGPERFAEARTAVEKAAAEGQPLQQFVVGVMSTDTNLTARYLNASRRVIRKLAEERGNPLAWYLLSLERNDLRMLHTAAKGGNVQALNALGSLATQEALEMKSLSSNEVSRILHRSFSYFERAAEQNDANGFVNLGACYLNGLGCDRDLHMAFICFKSAADLGHPEGMDCLSAAYALGHGVEKDMEKSAVWRMKAKAVRGDADARKWVSEKERLLKAK